MTDSPSLHILIVEDNDSLREATQELLFQDGHQVTAVSSAEEVDDTPTRDVPDLYLIDVNLPSENGFSLAERIRKSHPAAGIVLMTARGQLQDRLLGYNCGADNYLVKPVEQAELLVCIQNLARRLKPEKQDEVAGLVLDAQALNLHGPTDSVALTYAESLLLVAMTRAVGQKLERWQAMQLVDAKDKGLSPANLEMRISVLRKKMDACGAPAEAIRTIRGFGYALSCRVKVV
jgi:DNA-binding response OmpR family regulator